MLGFPVHVDPLTVRKESETVAAPTDEQLPLVMRADMGQVYCDVMVIKVRLCATTPINTCLGGLEFDGILRREDTELLRNIIAWCLLRFLRGGKS